MVDLNKLIQKAGDDLPLVQKREQRPGPTIGKRRPWLENGDEDYISNYGSSNSEANPRSNLRPEAVPADHPLNWPTSNPSSPTLGQREPNTSANPSATRGAHPSPEPSSNTSPNHGSNPHKVQKRDTGKPFIPTAVKERHLAVLTLLYESTVTTGTLRTEPILNSYLCRRIGLAEQGMRTLLKRFRGYGWLHPLSAQDIRQDGTIHTLDELTWKRMRDCQRETLVQRRPNPSADPGSKPLVSKLEEKKLNHQTDQLDIAEYKSFFDEDLQRELSAAGLIWTERDHHWASRNEIGPRVLAISLQHFLYDLQQGVIDKQGVKSYQAWFKGSLKRYAAYYSEGYMQLQIRRKAVEANYLSKVTDEYSCDEKTEITLHGNSWQEES